MTLSEALTHIANVEQIDPEDAQRQLRLALADKEIPVREHPLSSESNHRGSASFWMSVRIYGDYVNISEFKYHEHMVYLEKQAVLRIWPLDVEATSDADQSDTAKTNTAIRHDKQGRPIATADQIEEVIRKLPRDKDGFARNSGEAEREAIAVLTEMGLAATSTIVRPIARRLKDGRREAGNQPKPISRNSQRNK